MVQRYAHHSIESLRNGIEILETLKNKASEENHVTIISQSKRQPYKLGLTKS